MGNIYQECQFIIDRKYIVMDEEGIIDFDDELVVITGDRIGIS